MLLAICIFFVLLGVVGTARYLYFAIESLFLFRGEPHWQAYGFLINLLYAVVATAPITAAVWMYRTP